MTYLAMPSCHLQPECPPPSPLGHIGSTCRMVWNVPSQTACPLAVVGQCWLCPGPGSLGPWLLQANVEHMTEKMKTEIQRGLVLR